jgi:hypothetical protein
MACTAALVFFIGVARPLYNWDIVGYVAFAYHADGYRGAELSSKTYGALRGEVEADVFYILPMTESTRTPYSATPWRCRNRCRSIQYESSTSS